MHQGIYVGIVLEIGMHTFILSCILTLWILTLGLFYYFLLSLIM